MSSCQDSGVWGYSVDLNSDLKISCECHQFCYGSGMKPMCVYTGTLYINAALQRILFLCQTESTLNGMFYG